MTQKELIRQEIERLKIDYLNRSYTFVPATMQQLLEFIDSLPEETCKDSLQVHETCKENTDSFTSLEEAASRGGFDYVDNIVQESPGHRWNDHDVEFGYRDGFIAGAEWQANQLLKGSPLPEDTVLFHKGVEEGKRLMMEEAVEGEIGYWNQRGLSIRLDKSLERLGYDMDTKVKIVIVKE